MKGPARKMEALASAIGRGARPEIERLIEEGLIEKVSADEGGSAPKVIRCVRLLSPPDETERERAKKRAPKQAAVLQVLDEPGGENIPLREIEARVPGSRAFRAVISSLP